MDTVYRGTYAQFKSIREDSQQLWKIKAAPHNLASRFGERFFVKSRFEKRRNTVCISSFSNCGIGGKDPPKCADTIVRCCLKFYVDSARKNFEQAQQRTSHKQDQEI